MPQTDNQKKIYQIIFGTNTRAGKLFDIILIVVILLSVLLITIGSLQKINQQYYSLLYAMEWFFTAFFVVEYALRIYCSPKKTAYIFSFYGIVDFLSILPAFIGLIIPDAHQLTVIRLIRVLRIFRVLKLARHVKESNVLIFALFRARRKVLVFFSSVLVITVIFGSILFVVEGSENGFTSIPRSIYFAIVTITTVGYGDIIPQTSLGQAITSLMMLTGYAIIAVPTGIITAELGQEINTRRNDSVCPNCAKSGHEADSLCCRFCGSKLNDVEV